MTENHATEQKTDRRAHGRTWSPSRGFWIGIAGVSAFALVLTVAGVFAAVRQPEPVTVSGATPRPEPVQVSVAPRETTPPDDLTRHGRAPAGAPMVAGDASVARAAADDDDDEKTFVVSSSWWMAPLPEDGDPNVAISGTSVSPVEPAPDDD